MEEKKLIKFTFYEMYYETLKKKSDEYAGRLIQSICKYVFDGISPELSTDDMLMSFDIEHMFKTLSIATEIESHGRMPKTLNKKMKHFTFYDSYYKAIKLLD